MHARVREMEAVAWAFSGRGAVNDEPEAAAAAGAEANEDVDVGKMGPEEGVDVEETGSGW